MIIRGGENIYPRELEDLLFAIQVGEVAVVGLPRRKMGRRGRRVHPGRHPARIDEEELFTYMRAHARAAQDAAAWFTVEEFPQTGRERSRNSSCANSGPGERCGRCEARPLLHPGQLLGQNSVNQADAGTGPQFLVGDKPDLKIIRGMSGKSLLTPGVRSATSRSIAATPMPFDHFPDHDRGIRDMRKSAASIGMPISRR